MGDVASQCGIEAGEVDVLINDPNHPRWSDGSFEHTPVINQRSFQQFLHATEDMNE